MASNVKLNFKKSIARTLAMVTQTLFIALTRPLQHYPLSLTKFEKFYSCSRGLQETADFIVVWRPVKCKDNLEY